jgi:hypothetical protein
MSLDIIGTNIFEALVDEFKQFSTKISIFDSSFLSNLTPGSKYIICNHNTHSNPKIVFLGKYDNNLHRYTCIYRINNEIKFNNFVIDNFSSYYNEFRNDYNILIEVEQSFDIKTFETIAENYGNMVGKNYPCLQNQYQLQITIEDKYITDVKNKEDIKLFPHACYPSIHLVANQYIKISSKMYMDIKDNIKKN